METNHPNAHWEGKGVSVTCTCYSAAFENLKNDDNALQVHVYMYFVCTM